MAMPPEIERVVVTWGHAFDVLGGGVTSELRIEPVTPGTNKLVWLATGDVLLSMQASKRAEDSEGASISLPVVDQEGWVDAAGHPYMDWAYKATIVWSSPAGKQTETKTFKVLTGQTSVDLDLIFTGHVGAPTVAPLAVVTDVAGLSGSVTKAALEDMGLGASDEGVAALVDADGSQVRAAVSALGAARSQGYTSTAGLVARATNAATALTTPTYDSTGQATHPSVLHIPEGFGGYTYWMGMTPYAGGNNAVENPSILASRDGFTWVVPVGHTNPLAPKPTDHATSFNSDTCLTYAEGWLYCFWRSYRGGDAATSERFYCRRTRDGVTWEPEVVVRAAAASEQWVSPAVEYDPTSRMWTMWTVSTDGANRVLQLQAETPAGPWSAPATCTGFDFPDGAEVWHLSVRNFGGEYVCVALVTTGGAGVTNGSLWRLTSRDGVSFTRDHFPLLRPLVASSAWDAGLYHATMQPATVDGVPGYRLWYGGIQGGNVWRIGHTLAALAPRDVPQAPMRAAVAGLGGDIADTFDRPDSTTTAGTTSTGARAWAKTGSWLADPGIIDGQLYFPAGSAGAITVDHVADAEVGVTVAAKHTEGELSLICRWSALQDYVRLNILPAGGLTLEAWTAGERTPLAATGTVVPAGSRISLRAVGSTVSAYVDGVMVARADLPVPGPSGARVGLGASRAEWRADDFWARRIT